MLIRIVVMPSGTTIEDSFVQLEKAKEPISWTLLGISMDDKFQQAANASLPIDVTLLGMMTDVKL